MCRHMYNWNIVAYNVKQHISLTRSYNLIMVVNEKTNVCSDGFKYEVHLESPAHSSIEFYSDQR